MVKQAYCSKELSLLLWEKGIDASHVRKFEKGGSWYRKYTLDVAERWLKDVHRLYVDVIYLDFLEHGEVWSVKVVKMATFTEIPLPDTESSREEARAAGIEYCLLNLI